MADREIKNRYGAFLNSLMGAADSLVDTAQLVPDAYAGAKYYLGAGDGKAYQLPNFANSGVADKDSAAYQGGNLAGTGAQFLIPVGGLASAGAKAARAAEGAGMVGKAVKFAGGATKAALTPSKGKAAMAAGAGTVNALAEPARLVEAGGEAEEADPLAAGLAGAGTAYLLTPAKGGGKTVDLGESKRPVADVYGKEAGAAAEALKNEAAKAGDAGMPRLENAKTQAGSGYLPEGTPLTPAMQDALKNDIMNAAKAQEMRQGGDAAAMRKNDDAFYSFNKAHQAELEAIAAEIKAHQKEVQLNSGQAAAARRNGDSALAEEFARRAQTAGRSIADLQNRRDALNAAAKAVQAGGVETLKDEGGRFSRQFAGEPNIWAGSGFERANVSPIEQAERIARNSSLPAAAEYPQQRGVWINDADFTAPRDGGDSLAKRLTPAQRESVARIRRAAVGDSKSGSGNARTAAEMHLQGERDPYPALKEQGGKVKIEDIRNALGRDLDAVDRIKLNHFIQTGGVPENGIAGIPAERLAAIGGRGGGGCQRRCGGTGGLGRNGRRRGGRRRLRRYYWPRDGQ